MSEEKKPKKTQRDKPDETSRTGESKSEKFKRLAEMRVQKATWSIQSIGKLANRYNYDYADADAQKILRHLQSELDEVRKKFISSQKRKQKFSLG